MSKKKHNGRPDRHPGSPTGPSHEHSRPSPASSHQDISATGQAPPKLPADSPPWLSSRNFPEPSGKEFDVFLGTDGNAYILPNSSKNPVVLRLGTKAADAFLRQCAYQRGRLLKAHDVRDATDTLIAHAELARSVRDVWVRVAPHKDGFELDIGDEGHLRVRVTPGEVDIVTAGSTPFFWRPATQQPLPTVSPAGDLHLFRKYVNLHPAERVLLETWLVYTLAHAKLSTTVFVILLLLGPQGAGKSVLTRMIQSLIDPSAVGVQVLSRSPRDLAVAAPQCHLLAYDNAREIPDLMSDLLCLTSTGGSYNARRLYTDGEQVSLQLRVAVVLNSLHPILEQPDLAQRCLPLTLQPINSQARRSEKELIEDFEADRPAIFRGLLDRAAAILAELPKGKPSQPERMADFSAWLAAAERIDGAPTGAYELEYARVLTAGMRDALLENPLAAAVMSLLEGRDDRSWAGTPAELLSILEDHVPRRATYSPGWPRTPSAMSKRLRSLSGGLGRQGIELELGRGRERRITLTLREDFDHA